MNTKTVLLTIFLAFSFLSCDINNNDPDISSINKEKLPPDSPDESNYLTPPTLSSPANNSYQEPSLTFIWDKPSENPSFTRYRLEIDDNSDFSSIEYSYSGISSDRKLVSGLSRNVKYYWRVTAYDPNPPLFPANECCFQEQVQLNPLKPDHNLPYYLAIY